MIPKKNGELTLDIAVPRAARYRVWLGGSTRGRISVAVNGSRVGSVEGQLQNGGQWLDVGTAGLPGGTQRVTIAVSLPKLSPGTGGGSFPLGPLLLQPLEPARLLAPTSPNALCGRNLDWVEAIAPTTG